MREIRETVDIEARPERVWEWLSALAENYTAWHPGHREAVWERGAPNQVGSVLRADEELGGHREVLRFQLTSIDAPRRYEYRLRGPISLLLPRGAFAVLPRDGGSRFVASLWYRFGWLTERLFRARDAALRAHMREEGENLKRLLEA